MTASGVVIGLTGSIGMGKSTTAQMFLDEGVPVWDADQAVHRLYTEDREVIAEIGKLCPDAVLSGVVDRSVLRDWIGQTGDRLAQLERIVHPRIAKDRNDFLESNPSQIVVLDVPLLFETSLDTKVDYIVVVSAPADVQRQRVLERGNMSAAQFDAILAKQVPNSEKRARADFVIETTSLEQAQSDVHDVLEKIRKSRSDA